MTTESTELRRLVPAGEPFTDLLDELQVLGRRSNSEGDDWIPIDEFYIELNRISAEACRRMGEPFYPMPKLGIPPADYEPSEADLEEAFAFWLVVRAEAENRDRSLPRYTNEEVWAEFEDEIRAYEEEHGLSSVFDD